MYVRWKLNNNTNIDCNINEFRKDIIKHNQISCLNLFEYFIPKLGSHLNLFTIVLVQRCSRSFISWSFQVSFHLAIKKRLFIEMYSWYMICEDFIVKFLKTHKKEINLILH